MNSNEILDQIEKLITKDELEKAIAQLKSFLNESPLLEELIVQSARYNNVMRRVRIGTIKFEDSDLTLNQIRSGLFEMIRIFRTGAQDDIRISKEIENISNLENNITITNSKNVIVGNVNSDGGNIHLGDIIHEKQAGQIEWSDISVFHPENESPYKIENKGNDKHLIPISSLQQEADWPGKFRQVFPLTLDLKFLNIGDKSEMINAIEIIVKDVYLDDQVALETKPFINENGNLILSLENYGWGKNRIIHFEPFSKKASPYWNLKDAAFKTIQTIDGHTRIEFTPEDAIHLNPISNEEHQLLIKKFEKFDPCWTPNPYLLLFEDASTLPDHLKEDNEFSNYRKKLIAENKILESSSFFGKIIFEQNNQITERKLHWGYISHSARSFDLIKTDTGFQLFSYQEMLAYMPPSMEYNCQLSINDKGKTISIDTAHLLKGDEGDRILLTIEPMECLFADIELQIKCRGEKKVLFPHPIRMNLIKYKDNGSFETEHANIPLTTYLYQKEQGKLEKV